jgi:hypothetical protein
MPNWCNNTLDVSGDEKSIAAFLKAARGRHAGYTEPYFTLNSGDEAWPSHDHVRVKAIVKNPAPLYGDTLDFCMNALYPVPLDYRRFPFDDNQARKLGDAVGEVREYGGYQWQSSHWGTKWDVMGELLESEETFLQYQFDSAWGPPVSFLEKVCGDFPELTFELTFYEGGMGFAGRCTFDQGEFVDEEDLPIEDFVDYEDEEDCPQDEQPMSEYMSSLEEQHG